MKRKLICAQIALMIVLLLLTAMPIGAVASGGFDGEAIPVPVQSPAVSTHLGRDGLEGLPKAEALLYAYDRIVEGVEACAEEITVKSAYGNLTVEDIATVVDAYRRDRADHFWFGSSYGMRGTEEAVTKFVPSYEMTGDALAEARVAFEGAINAFLNGVTSNMSAFDKELLLHDRLAAHVTYTMGAPNAHNAYGALVEGKAVCEGYAEALQVLLHRVGVESVIMLGTSINPATGSPENHAWNVVGIGGKYYHVDLTWNDQAAHTYHAYFNVTDAMIGEDHTIEPTALSLPACNETDLFYFNLRGVKVGEGYTAELVGSIMATQELQASIYVTADVQTFINWFMDNIREIATAAGVRGTFKYGYTRLGRECILTIDACLHKNLTYVPASPVGCETDGNHAYYTCTCGKWFEDAAAERVITDHATVSIRSLGHLFTEKIEDEEHLRESAADCRTHDTYFYTCAKCGAVSDDAYFESDMRGAHVLPLTLVEAVTPDCDTAGKEAYYTCACGDCFEDAEGTLPIADINAFGVIPAAGHDDSDGDGTCDVCAKSTAPYDDGKPDKCLGVGVTLQALLPWILAGGGVVLLVILIAVLARKRRF